MGFLQRSIAPYGQPAASGCGGETVIKGSHCISDLIPSQQNAAVRELQSSRGTPAGPAHRVTPDDHILSSLVKQCPMPLRSQAKQRFGPVTTVSRPALRGIIKCICDLVGFSDHMAAPVLGMTLV
jgi:hypothetical protein